MAVRRVKNRWLVEFMQAGHRVFKRLPEEATRADAVAYEAKLRREIFDQATLGRKPSVPLTYAIETWLKEVNRGRKSEKSTDNHAQAVIRICGSEGVSGIPDAASKVKASRSYENDTRAAGGAVRNGEPASQRSRPGSLSDSTINRRLCVLKAVAKFAWKKGWTEENLSARIQLLPENNARHTYLTPEEVEKLIKATPDRSKAYVALAVYTGLRQGQVLKLTPQDCINGAIRLADSKGGIPLLIPLVPASKPFLEALPLKLHKRTYYGDFEIARKAIGREDLHYHDLRHTTASLMIQNGVPLYTVGEILGHKSVQTTKRYAHLAEHNKRDALLAAFPSPVPQETGETSQAVDSKQNSAD